MTLSEAFEALRGKYGSHSAAARALSINVSYYRDIRNGRAKLTNRMRTFVLLMAADASIHGASGRHHSPAVNL